MDNIIVYVDDADYALHQLRPMEGTPDATRVTHWVMVACPPRMTRHVSKWVNHSARENWRVKWAEKLFARVCPELQARGDKVTQIVARRSLAELTQELQRTHGVARVFDARRPKLGQELPPVTPDQPTDGASRWTVPGAVAGMGAILVLASE